MSNYLCGPSAFHPYECSHDKYCEHCTNANLANHVPEQCWLCCDGDPATSKPIKFVKDRFAKKVYIHDLSRRYQKILVNRVIQERLPF